MYRNKDVSVIFLHCLYIADHSDSFTEEAHDVIRGLAYQIYKECNFTEEEFNKIASKYVLS